MFQTCHTHCQSVPIAAGVGHWNTRGSRRPELTVCSLGNTGGAWRPDLLHDSHSWACKHKQKREKSDQIESPSKTCCCLVAKSCLTLWTPWTAARQASRSFTVSWSLLILRPLSQWCHATISSSAVPFPSCPQSFPASGSCPASQLLASGGQSIGVSASAPVLPMNIQGWFP